MAQSTSKSAKKKAAAKPPKRGTGNKKPPGRAAGATARSRTKAAKPRTGAVKAGRKIDLPSGPVTAARLNKVLGLTGSNNDGEALSAIRKANDMLSGADLRWPQVIALPPKERLAGSDNSSQFADRAIERLGWPEPFKRCPLLRTGLELAIAVTFEKVRLGHASATTGGAFAELCCDTATNFVVDRIDMVSSDDWPGNPILQAAFRGVIEKAFEKSSLAQGG